MYECNFVIIEVLCTNHDSITQIEKKICSILDKEGRQGEDEVWLEDSLAALLHYENEIACEDVPIGIFHSLSKRVQGIDTLVIGDNGQLIVRELAQMVHGELNHLYIVTEEEERWERFAEEAYEEYGLLVVCSRKLNTQLTPRAICFDFTNQGNGMYVGLGKESLYVDFYPDPHKRHCIISKRPDLSYMRYTKFLDNNWLNTI